MKKLIKKFMSTTVTTMLMLSVLTGCGGSSTSTTSNNSSTTVDESVINNTVEPTKQNTKNTIRLPLGSEIDSLDPMNSAAGDTSAVMMNVYDGLLYFTQEGEFAPALAYAYDILDDGLTYRFYLKDDVYFHNGEHFTSADVIYTYNQLAGFDGYEATSYTISTALESIKAIDDFTVEMHLKNLDAAFLTRCVNSIVKEGYGNDAVQPNGTGPYKFVEYIYGEQLTFIINENYNTSDKIPSVENIVVDIMTDSNAILLALKTGQLDIATILANDIPSLESEYNIYNYPQNMIQFLALNNEVDGLDNADVRKAINLAIDKQEIIDLACFGAGLQVETFMSPVMSVYYDNTLPEHKQDLETAKQLLVNAGYENFSFTVKVPSNYQTHVDTAQVIKDQLSKIDVNMEIELIEWATWLEDVYNNFNYEATICAQVGKIDPLDFINRFVSTYGKNYFRYSNTAYDEIIAKASNSYEQAELIKYVKEAQNMLVDETAAVFIQDPSLLYATTKDIGGIVNYPYRFIDFASFEIIS